MDQCILQSYYYYNSVILLHFSEVDQTVVVQIERLELGP